MTEIRAKAFDVVIDLTKQVITLSTALIALGVTFIKDFADTAPADARMWLASSWIALLFSVVLGLLTLMACAGILGRAKDTASADPYSGNARLLGGLQLITFLIGLGMAIIAGFMSV